MTTEKGSSDTNEIRDPRWENVRAWIGWCTVPAVVGGNGVWCSYREVVVEVVYRGRTIYSRILFGEEDVDLLNMDFGAVMKPMIRNIDYEMEKEA